VDVSNFQVRRPGDPEGRLWMHARSARLIRAEARPRLALDNLVLRHGTNEFVIPHAQLGFEATDAALHWRVGEQMVRLDPATMIFTTNHLPVSPHSP